MSALLPSPLSNTLPCFWRAGKFCRPAVRAFYRLGRYSETLTPREKGNHGRRFIDVNFSFPYHCRSGKSARHQKASLPECYGRLDILRQRMSKYSSSSPRSDERVHVFRSRMLRHCDRNNRKGRNSRMLMSSIPHSLDRLRKGRSQSFKLTRREP